jgi:hypothetical protein
MATEAQMDKLIDAVENISLESEDSNFDRDDVNSITDSLFRIAEALERLSPPPAPTVLTPANNYWKRKEWEKEHGREWTNKEQI